MNEQMGISVFGIVLSILVLKTVVLGMITAVMRGKFKKFATPEDARWLGGEFALTDIFEVQRFFKAQRNSLENLIPFFILGSLFLVLKGSPLVASIYFIIFLGARILHSFGMISARPMLRRNSYATGFLIIVILSFHNIYLIINHFQ